MRTFHLPDLGEGLEEAEIVAWHVAVGDHVVADQPLLSVETDKAVVEVPSPRSGRIKALLAEPGAIVKVGAPLVEFEEGPGVDAGAVVGELARAPEVVAPTPASAPAAGVRVAPAVRKRAAELGVDLARVTGSGPEGTVTLADVEAAAAASAPRPVPAEPEKAVELLPLRGVRRAMARTMARAHAEVVPATVVDEADIGRWREGTDVTLRLVRAIVAGCRAEPALNARFLSEAEGRVLESRIDVGIAVDLPDGLIVPVLRDVANRTPADLRAGLDRLKRDVRARTIPLAELKGATITLSNFGMLGGRFAQLVVVPPQVAILGAGRIREGVRVVGGAIRTTRLLPLSLTFDHRAVTGGEAARFLQAVIGDLELPD
ncbi:MAG: dihydrolipoamide acetyltransferase family protein [Geminicoccaceae bacterium]|nr:2-oxo acid dehydrogenase subunit E2 [Geminicoccaceae bacterium]MCS7268287.1 2-oxo acid dehydrogenase subunit E2 [Geminicoccaceae bacterium]MDW8340925.1 dihydrolipoamide acetyltransferase family protein [Geminicoccaceae bacterium]